jgi:hypothetical protein
MAHEGLGICDAQFGTAKSVHQLVHAVKLVGVLAGVGVAGLALARLGGRDIDEPGERVSLRLDAGHDLGVVELECLVHAQPGVVNEERGGPVVAMRIDRPRREDNVRLLGGKQVGDSLVRRIGDFAGSINLPGKQGTRFEDGTGLFRLGATNARCFRVRFAGDSGFAAGEIERHHFMTQIGIAGHGSSSGRFRIVRVRPGDDDLEPAGRRGGMALFGKQGQADSRGGSGAGGRDERSARDWFHSLSLHFNASVTVRIARIMRGLHLAGPSSPAGLRRKGEHVSIHRVGVCNFWTCILLGRTLGIDGGSELDSND